MNPFNFNVVMDGKQKLRRWACYTATAFLLTVIFVAGFITVYVNSYNVMHTEPIHVFEIHDDGVVFLDKYFPFNA